MPSAQDVLGLPGGPADPDALAVITAADRLEHHRPAMPRGRTAVARRRTSSDDRREPGARHPERAQPLAHRQLVLGVPEGAAARADQDPGRLKRGEDRRRHVLMIERDNVTLGGERRRYRARSRCEPIVTSWVTSAALSFSDSASTRNVAPRPTAAAAVIRASCPPPTMPTTGIPVPDFRAMGPAGPAGDNGESTPCSLRGTTQSWVQPTWRHEAATSRHPPASPKPRPRQPGEPSSSGQSHWPRLPAGSTHDDAKRRR